MITQYSSIAIARVVNVGADACILLRHAHSTSRPHRCHWKIPEIATNIAKRHLRISLRTK